MGNSPTAAQQYLKYGVIFHHPIVCWFLFFRNLKTRLSHCFKGCNFSTLEAMEQFCRVRCVHGTARKLFKGRAESGDDERSWAAFWRWTDLLERWWLRRSRELLACISHLVCGDMCVYVHISASLCLLIWESHLCLWHQDMVQVSALRDVFDSKDGSYDQVRSFCA